MSASTLFFRNGGRDARLQRLVELREHLEPRPRLVLPPAPTQCRLRQADQRGRMEGRSRKVTLPSVCSKRPAAGLRSMPPPRCVSRMNGKSDHSGWADPLGHRMEVRGAQRLLGHERKAGAPASPPRVRAVPRRSTLLTFASASIPAATSASRPIEPASVPARTGEGSLVVPFNAKSSADYGRYAAQHAVEVRQGLAHADAARIQYDTREWCFRGRWCAS